MNNALTLFKGLLITALGGIYCYGLFHIALYAFSTDAQTGTQILLFMLGFAGWSLLSALVAGIAQPAIYAAGLVWCGVWSLIARLINRRRSHA
ncbi:hypothetical protein ACYVUX_000377 [Salmonella enterica]